MSEAWEIGVVRMQEQMKAILEDMAEAKQSRKEQYKRLDEVGKEVAAMNHRLHNVEQQVASAAPTLAEFVVLKHKIAGAGTLGRWLWAVGGFLIGSVAWVAGIGKLFRAWFEGN